MIDPRYDKISELFVQYSNGNFDYQLELSEKLDEIDAFISSVNMLGEELKEITISKEFFNNVFNSVSDLVFVLDINGFISMVNKAVQSKIGFSQEDLKGTHIDVLFENGKESFFRLAVERTALKITKNDFDSTFYFAKKSYPSLCTFNKLHSQSDEHIGYTLIVKDLSNLKKAEEMVRLSEEKFKKLFDESGDAILIINQTGKILEVNSASVQLLGASKTRLKKFTFFDFLMEESDIEKVRFHLKKYQSESNLQLHIFNKESKRLHVCLMTISKLSRLNEFQILLKDVTIEKEMENRLIRTIVDTQEKERIRFARDIHDSLGQQLSAIKFYLSTLSSTKQSPEKNQNLIEMSERGVNTILTNLREICFNLMPKTIENFGLLAGVNEICKNYQATGQLLFNISAEENFPRLSFDKEIAVFRIVQEFINNSIKHAQAKRIDILFRYTKTDILVTLFDDGIGFDSDAKEIGAGMGLKNVLSRARSHNGQLRISSSVSEGTRYELKLPIENIYISELKKMNI